MAGCYHTIADARHSTPIELLQKVVFRRVSKYKIVSHLLRHTIGLKNSRHFIIQSEVKLSRALCQLHISTWSFDWLTALSVFCYWPE